MAVAIAPLTKIVASSRRQDEECKICGDTDGRCKHGDRGELCMNIHHGTTHGFRLIGPCRGNTAWSLWVPDDGETADESAIARHREESAQRERDRLNKLAQGMPPAERHRHYSAILDRLTITDGDRAMMVARGMSEEQIRRFGGRSVLAYQKLAQPMPEALPGLMDGGRALANALPGFLVPVRNVRGQIVACQIRVDSNSEGGKYRWLSGTTSAHMPIGENPLAVCLPQGDTPPEPGIVGLCEGTGFKPFLGCDRLNIPMIGASGGQFASSPKILLGTLEYLQARRVLFFPDAGAIENPHILAQYSKTFELLKQHGYDVRIGWWGQKSKEIGNMVTMADVDTLDELRLKNIDYIKLSDLWRISESHARKLLMDFQEEWDRTENIQPAQGGAIAILKQLWALHRCLGYQERIDSANLAMNSGAWDDEKRKRWAIALAKWQERHGTAPVAFCVEDLLKRTEPMIRDYEQMCRTKFSTGKMS